MNNCLPRLDGTDHDSDTDLIESPLKSPQQQVFCSGSVPMEETKYFLHQNAPNVVCVRAPAGFKISLPSPVYGLWLCWIFIRGLFTGNQSEGPARCSALGPAVGQTQQGPQPCVTDHTSITIPGLWLKGRLMLSFPLHIHFAHKHGNSFTHSHPSPVTSGPVP